MGAFMTRIVFPLAVALAAALSATSAHAQNAARTFVSAASGSDSNPCSRTLPCRTFAFAITQTNAGGEINTLDPGGYGPVTITKSISIISGLGEAGVLVPSGGTGITISAGPNDKINLRGLIIEGAGVGQTGIAFGSGAALTIVNCVIRNLTGSGIANGPTTSAKITISNTTVSDNGGHGIYVQPSGNNLTVNAFFNRVEAYNNGLQGIGIFSNFITGGTSPLTATMVDSISANNGQNGYYCLGDVATCNCHLFRSTASQNNGFGVFSDAHSTFTVAQSEFEGDMLGPGSRGSSGGIILTYQDNYTSTFTFPSNTLVMGKE
jgi:parallel beta-helix repeat protein